MQDCTNHQLQSGYTILESIVALFIFSVIAAAILNAMGTADKIRSKASIVMKATRIAENEFEHIRQKVPFTEAIEDCTWTVNSGGPEFQVERRVLLPDSVKFGNSEPSLMEIELVITASRPIQQKYQFRMLQGNSW